MTKIETANSIIKSSGDIAQTNDVQAFVPNSTCLTKLSDSEISIIEPLLLQVDSDEADRFRQYLKEGKILRCRVFNEQGVYIAYKDESGYSLIFSFKEVMRDYTIATYLENEIKKLLSLKKSDEKFTVIHDTKQLYLQQFLFKAKFKKPHCGLEYRLDRVEIPQEPLNELERTPMKSEDIDKYFAVHMDAFAEQDMRADEPASPNDKAYKWFTQRFLSDDVDFYGYRIGEEIVGYALFDGNILDYFVVNPAFQHKGYGKKILRDCLRQKFLKTDIDSIRLYTYLINLNAQALYESVGFRVVGEYTINKAECTSQ